MKSALQKSRAASNGAGSNAENSHLKDKLKRKEYEKELARLHVELVSLQQWVDRKSVV